ncbi:MAG: TrmH family RNA methyltransferase [Acidobacteriota bacterium]
MQIKRITSPQNPIAKKVRSAAQGEEAGHFLLEGRHLLREALAVEWPLECVLVDEDHWQRWQTTLGTLEERVFLCPAALLRRLGTAPSPEGVLALGIRRDPSWPRPRPGDRFLYLDAVQDPVNVGILVRSARAFGVAGAFVGPGTADPFRPTALSRSAGAALHIPLVATDAKDFLRWKSSHGVALLAAEAGGLAAWDREPVLGPWALAVGNEGRGLSEPIRTAADALVGIPMEAGWDSLNVAAAGSILLYSLAQGINR